MKMGILNARKTSNFLEICSSLLYRYEACPESKDTSRVGW